MSFVMDSSFFYFLLV